MSLSHPLATQRACKVACCFSPLFAPNGEVYGEAQGPLVIGGYSEGVSGNSKSVNHLTVGRIAEGGIVERDAAVD